MKRLFKAKLLVIFLGFLFVSCDISELGTFFEKLDSLSKDTPVFEAVFDFESLSDLEKTQKAIEFTDIALDEKKSVDLFSAILEEDKFTGDAISNIVELIDLEIQKLETDEITILNLGSYHEFNMAKAKILVYPYGSGYIKNINTTLNRLNRISVEIEYSVESGLDKIFGDETENLEELFNNIYLSQEPLDKIANSFISLDYPESVAITEDDIGFVILSMGFGKVIRDTMDSNSLLTSSGVSASLSGYIGSGDGTGLVFPSHNVALPYNSVEKYLGENGILLYAATKYKVQNLKIQEPS